MPRTATAGADDRPVLYNLAPSRYFLLRSPDERTKEMPWGETPSDDGFHDRKRNDLRT